MIVSNRFHPYRNPRPGSDVDPCAQDLKSADGLSDLSSEGEPSDAGMTTAEYAVGTIAACTFTAAISKAAQTAIGSTGDPVPTGA
jgi:hypothetical protein